MDIGCVLYAIGMSSAGCDWHSKSRSLSVSRQITTLKMLRFNIYFVVLHCQMTSCMIVSSRALKPVFFFFFFFFFFLFFLFCLFISFLKYDYI